MKLLKSLLLVAILFAYGFTLSAQNDVSIRQEFSITPSFLSKGQREVNALTTIDEQSSGFGMSYGYAVYFNWFGPSMTYFTHFAAANEDAFSDLGFSSADVSSNYEATGLLLGLHVNVPVTQNDFKSYATFNLEYGPFVATVPMQKLTSTSGEEYTVGNADGIGLGSQYSFGLKADIINRFSAGLSYCFLKERADITMNSDITSSGIDIYNWNFTYSKFDLSIIYHL